MEVLEADDPRLALYRGLNDPALRRASEPAQGVFVIEGKLALQAALASPYPLLSVLVLGRRAHALDDLDLPAGVPVYVVDDEVMAGTTGFDVHRGILAMAGRLPLRDVADLARARLVVVVEGVNDQENLGAIFRNAAAFGAGAVLLDPTSADPLYRRTVRVSLGQALRVPFTRLQPWPAALHFLEKEGFALLALTPSARASPVDEVAALVQGGPVAVVVGAEGKGLTEAVLRICRPVRIPMAAGVDSLNVAAATAVALHRLSVLA